MKLVWAAVFVLAFLAGNGHGADPVEPGAAKSKSLLEARRGFATTLVRKVAFQEPVLQPPADVFRCVEYPSPGGHLAAYVSPPPKDGKKHPAIIWLFGGFSNSIGETAWKPASRENDQSARAFREAGIVVMYPSLRGGNNNPGFMEGFYGEVDDVLAAVDYLEKLDYVDPKRVYLGGHSTGGTLALLVAESTRRLRAVFAFGPVADVAVYGPDHLPFDVLNRREVNLRAPGRWLDAIEVPVFVFEGTARPSNIQQLTAMSRTCSNLMVHFHPVTGATHFSILAPVTGVIAAKILSDDGPAPNLVFEEKELSEAMRR
jgi:acetyl esterase/lipase